VRKDEVRKEVIVKGKIMTESEISRELDNMQMMAGHKARKDAKYAKK